MKEWQIVLALALIAVAGIVLESCWWVWRTNRLLSASAAARKEEWRLTMSNRADRRDAECLATKTCASCRFYVRDLSDSGECRRRAPTLTAGIDGSYPRTPGASWCGEYEWRMT
jgi:hypothetical protein